MSTSVPAEGSDHPLLSDLDPAEASRATAGLVPVQAEAGAELMREGTAGRRFLLVTAGHLSVRRASGGIDAEVAQLGPGAIVGELAVLRGETRAATVVALEPVTALQGDATALRQLLEVDSVRERLVRTAAARLAANAKAVPVEVRDGSTVWIRPALPHDRSRAHEVLDGMSVKSRYQRFFTTTPIGDWMLDRLVDIDYVNHFAWAVLDAPDGPVVGDARYVRYKADPDAADVAFALVDAHQGRGIGSVLLPALEVAARVNGVRRFTAEVLATNRSMLRILEKTGGASTSLGQTVEFSIPVADRPGRGLDGRTVEELEDSVRSMTSVAASLAA